MVRRVNLMPLNVFDLVSCRSLELSRWQGLDKRVETNLTFLYMSSPSNRHIASRQDQSWRARREGEEGSGASADCLISQIVDLWLSCRQAQFCSMLSLLALKFREQETLRVVLQLNIGQIFVPRSFSISIF